MQNTTNHQRNGGYVFLFVYKICYFLDYVSFQYIKKFERSGGLIRFSLFSSFSIVSTYSLKHTRQQNNNNSQNLKNSLIQYTIQFRVHHTFTIQIIDYTTFLIKYFLRIVHVLQTIEYDLTKILHYTMLIARCSLF